MNALIIIAHGSKQEASNTEITELTTRIARQHKTFNYIECCFLEFATPTFSEVVSALACKQVKHITVVPYFLANGAHVQKDIPREITQAATAHSDITIQLTKHIGIHPLMEKIIIESTQNNIK